MTKIVLFIICLVAFSTITFAQERDIIDFAAKNPRALKVQNPDGTYRTPKYGDQYLEQAVERLKNYSQPFTVSKVISWFSKAKDEKIRVALLRVLAVSRDPRGAIVLGNSLKDDSVDVRIAAAYGLMDYFLPSITDGGSEQQMIAVEEWWEGNRERLEREAKRLKKTAKANHSIAPKPIN